MFLIDESTNKAITVEKKTFQDLNFKEREHLQEWIAANPEILGESLLIIQKEFSDWSDTNERIDLLALDERGNLVIIENKLDDSGRDVVWQALKYVSYCAGLSKSEIKNIYQKYLGNAGNADDMLQEFFDQSYEDIELNPVDGDQRIILVAANFRKEVTSTALWLADHSVDITCVKVTPYKDNDRIYLDSERILPLQDAGDYVVRLSAKKQEAVARKFSETARAQMNFDFWEAALPELRKNSKLFQNISPSKGHWLGGAVGHAGIGLNPCIYKDHARLELYIDTRDKEKNKRVFRELEKQRNELEEKCGSKFVWQELPDKRASRISLSSERGGINDTDDWDTSINFLSKNVGKMHDVFKPALDKILG